jgi:hypothetical protein
MTDNEPFSQAELVGMTREKCADACRADRCVISRRGICAHPSKTGLQVAQANDLAALDRLQAARVFCATMPLISVGS